MRTEFYTCDVCGAEMDPAGPCFRAVEVSSPAAYVPTYEVSLPDGRCRYVCPGCLPLKLYRRRADPGTPATFADLWNALVARLRSR